MSLAKASIVAVISMAFVPVATLAAPRIVTDCYQEKALKSAFFLVRSVGHHAEPPVELEKFTANCALEGGNAVFQVSPFWQGREGHCRRTMYWDVNVKVSGKAVFERNIREKNGCEYREDDLPFLGSVEVYGNQMTVCETSFRTHGHGSDLHFSAGDTKCTSRSLEGWQAETVAIAK